MKKFKCFVSYMTIDGKRAWKLFRADSVLNATETVNLIAWGVSCAKCTELRELPEKPIPMEHEHGGEDDGPCGYRKRIDG